MDNDEIINKAIEDECYIYLEEEEAVNDVKKMLNEARADTTRRIVELIKGLEPELGKEDKERYMSYVTYQEVIKRILKEIQAGR